MLTKQEAQQLGTTTINNRMTMSNKDYTMNSMFDKV
jgi:hypothetical protein